MPAVIGASMVAASWAAISRSAMGGRSFRETVMGLDTSWARTGGSFLIATLVARIAAARIGASFHAPEPRRPGGGVLGVAAARRNHATLLRPRNSRPRGDGRVTSPAQPRHFRPGEGKTYTLGRITLTFKTTAGDNGGAYTLCEAIEPPQSGAGLHRHPTYDETHIICEGHYEFQLGERMLALHPVDMVFAPR